MGLCLGDDLCWWNQFIVLGVYYVGWYWGGIQCWYWFYCGWWYYQEQIMGGYLQ